MVLVVERKCVGCGIIKDRENLIKITAQNSYCDIIVNGGPKIFGRSAYLCYNNSCIENALKKNKLQKALKVPVTQELKGKLLNEL
ncbi:MAG: YlxR family protein [Cyanobacteria bacterium SIG32]|nr:YlxR family protein [Cyanobacteria bacterium SIG32]